MWRIKRAALTVPMFSIRLNIANTLNWTLVTATNSELLHAKSDMLHYHPVLHIRTSYPLLPNISHYIFVNGYKTD